MATVKPGDRDALRALLEHRRGNPSCEMTHSQLGEAIGRSKVTAQRKIYSLRNAGHLSYTTIWVSPTKSLPNRYKFPKLEGFTEPVHKVIIFDDQVLKLNTNTNTLKTNTAISPEIVEKTLPEMPKANAGPNPTQHRSSRPAFSRSESNHDPKHRERVEHNRRMKAEREEAERLGREMARKHNAKFMQRGTHNTWSTRPDANVGTIREDGYYSGQTAQNEEDIAYAKEFARRDRERIRNLNQKPFYNPANETGAWFNTPEGEAYVKEQNKDLFAAYYKAMAEKGEKDGL